MVDFLLSFLLWLSILGFLAALCVAAYFYWRYYLSIRSIPPDMVGIMLFLGKPQVSTPPKKEDIYTSGPCFVPWCPIKWDGHRLWELQMIPKRQMLFSIGGKTEHRVWSRDRQLLLVDTSGYLRFPYEDVESLVKILESRVPLTERALDLWVEEEVVAGLRDAMAGFDHDQAIGKSNLTAIRDEAKKFFLDKANLFYRSGICGKDPRDFTPGTGEVIIRVDTVNPTDELQKAMQAPVVTKYQVIAAKNAAEVDAATTGAPLDLMMEKWIDGLVAQSGKNKDVLIAELRKSGEYKRRERIFADFINRKRAGGGTVKEAQIKLGNLDGTSFGEGSVAQIVGGIAAAFAGKEAAKDEGSKSGDKKSGTKRKKVEDMTPAEKKAELEE